MPNGPYPDNVNPGMFLPTTPMFDVGDLDETTLKQLVVQLTQFVNNIAVVLNKKDSALYVLEQFVNGQLFFPNPVTSSSQAQSPDLRQVYRQVFSVGPLPNTGQILIPHGIAPTSIFTFTRIYGCASDTTGLNYIPLPESFVNGHIVDLAVNMTNIVINTNWNASNFNITYIVLEWLPY